MLFADNITKKCAYCHEPLNVWESITESGKWYHETCKIHELGAEIDSYKKKWIDGKLTLGDKVELLELYNLRQNLIRDRTEFKGFARIGESTSCTPKRKVKALAWAGENTGTMLINPDGTPKFVEIDDGSEVKTYSYRPIVEKVPIQQNFRAITMAELPKLLGVPEGID